MNSTYIPRIVDTQLSERLSAIGAVLITGPKWCGKTTTATQFANSILTMQDPDNTAKYLETAAVKPSLLLKGENPRLIDEWQMAPVIWDAVRTAVDKRGEAGLFILTGSTTVDETKIMHSGTGRISRMDMYPMSLFESQDSNGQISLNELFNDSNLDIDGVATDLTLEKLIFVSCRGGWPSCLRAKSDKAMLFIARDYVLSICNTDASTIDGVNRNPERVRAVLRSYARNVSTQASNRTLHKDIASHYSDMSETTLSSYINALERLFVIQDVPAWCPSIRSATTIRASRKREFIDPSIAIAALEISPDELMMDMKTFGLIFECLCIRDLRVYSSRLGGHLSYYNDRYGLESDCVLHLPNGRYALIEVKLSHHGINEGAKHLLELKDLIQNANKSSSIKLREPDLLIVITGGEMAYTRKDGVKIIPIGCLKD